MYHGEGLRDFAETIGYVLRTSPTPNFWLEYATKLVLPRWEKGHGDSLIKAIQLSDDTTGSNDLIPIVRISDEPDVFRDQVMKWVTTPTAQHLNLSRVSTVPTDMVVAFPLLRQWSPNVRSVKLSDFPRDEPEPFFLLLFAALDRQTSPYALYLDTVQMPVRAEKARAVSVVKSDALRMLHIPEAVTLHVGIQSSGVEWWTWWLTERSAPKLEHLILDFDSSFPENSVVELTTAVTRKRPGLDVHVMYACDEKQMSRIAAQLTRVIVHRVVGVIKRGFATMMFETAMGADGRDYDGVMLPAIDSYV